MEPDGTVRIPLPLEAEVLWGRRERYHVTGSVAGHAVRGPLAEDGSLRLGRAWRRDHRLPDGEIEVVLRPEGPQLEGLDDDVREALDGSPKAAAFFESLATFYRKAYLTWLDGAKRRPEVRAARIREWITLLESGQKQRPR